MDVLTVCLHGDSCNYIVIHFSTQEVTRVGRPSTEGSSTPHQDIQLRGLGIINEHCVFEIVEGDVFVTPIKAAR